MHVAGWLTSARSADESEVVEFGDLILHLRRAVPQLGAVVLVVAGPQGDVGAVGDVAQGYDFEGHRQGLVGPPMGGQSRAEERRGAGFHQFAGMFREDFADLSLGPPPIGWIKRRSALLTGHINTRTSLIKSNNLLG